MNNNIPESRKVHILGGGTFSHVRNHLALAAPAFGTTARFLHEEFKQQLSKDDVGDMEPLLWLTKMADPRKGFHFAETNEDVEKLVDVLVGDLSTQIIIFNVAMCDYNGEVYGVPSGKHAERLSTTANPIANMDLTAQTKVVNRIRQKRKDIFLVAFKTTCGATREEQFEAGLSLLKNASCNLVIANDTETRNNMIITPEEAIYHETTDRNEILSNIVEMSLLRSNLKFTRSTVVDAEPIEWESDEVPSNLKTVVNHCINNYAYKPFNGATVGHFACKLDDTTFLTSRRKVDFNLLHEVGLVKVKTDGPDTVISYGGKPSVGGQSQRIVFDEHEGYDCIVHFHCPLKDDCEDNVPVRHQRPYECGSHECGQNTSDGLREVEDGIKVVMLDKHGPNIVFRKDVAPERVINLIERNFNLQEKT